MKKIIFFVVAVLSLPVLAQTGSKNFIDQPYIEIVGKAEMEVVPNKIYLNITINEKDHKVSLEEMEKTMINNLKAIDIAVEEQLSIKDMVSNFRTYWIRSNDIREHRMYQLVVQNAKMAGLVFRNLESAGISNINIEKVGHTDIQQLRETVKIEALKAAKAKANALVDAVGQSIGKAIYIEELEDDTFKDFKSRETGISNMIVKNQFEKEMKTDEPDIEFEKIKLEYAVLARFEI